MPDLLTDRSPIDALPRPLAVAVHDAGAANMIAVWAAAAQSPPDRVLVDGPAAQIWHATFGNSVTIENDPTALTGMQCVLSGTGWASDFEHRARIAASNAAIHSIAVIDHWVNYPQRFHRYGGVQLPDAIWVGDREAEQIALQAFPSLPVEQHPNLYAKQHAQAAGPVPSGGDVLFLLEPARSTWGHDEPGEFQALDYFQRMRVQTGIPEDIPLRIRPHPSDPVGKYDAWLAQHQQATFDQSSDLANALQTARWVVGMNSAALPIALAAGREVFCALPPWAPPCVLPHAGIKHLAKAEVSKPSLRA